MNIRYGVTCEINTESQKFEISDICIYISITEKKVKISRKLKRKKARNELHDLKVDKKLNIEH